MSLMSPHISMVQHGSSSCGHQRDTSVTAFEHNTLKPVTKAQQGAADSSLNFNVLSGVAHGGERSLLVGGERRGKDNTDQLVVIIHEVVDKVSSWPGLPIFSMPQSAPFVHHSFIPISPEMSKKVSLCAALSMTLIRTTLSEGA